MRTLVYGASGHALVVADLLRLLGREVAAFVDGVRPERDGEPFGGAVVRSEGYLDEALAAGVVEAAVAVGDNAARLAIGRRLLERGFRLPALVHPRAVVAGGVALGAGTVVCAGAVVAPAARLGALVLVNTGATVDHEDVLHDGVHVSPGAHLGGTVEVGEGTWVGIGAAVRHGVRIGAGSVVGAGAAVVADVPPGVVVVGVPARVLRPVSR